MSVGHLPDPDWYLDHVVVPSDAARHRVGPVRAWQGSWAELAHRLGTDADVSPVGAATRVALNQGFVLTCRQARECGMSDAAVRRLVRHGRWTRCGHGTLAVGGALSAASGR